jgi:predicted transcriptional regulator
MTIQISFRTEEKVREELDRIARSLDRSRNWVINEAIANYIDLHKWQLDQIKRGIRDSEEGRTFTTEEVEARLKKRNSFQQKQAAGRKK